jgi:hypothetical protein
MEQPIKVEVAALDVITIFPQVNTGKDLAYAIVATIYQNVHFL